MKRMLNIIIYSKSKNPSFFRRVFIILLIDFEKNNRY
jgi:hypothetical protein